MHIPVLLNEALSFLNPQSGESFIDCTLGGGGHFREIQKRIMPEGKILGIDLSGDAIERVKAENLRNTFFAKGNFKNLKKIAGESGFSGADGILMDLGFSSIELESGIGLSFQKDEPLDMRMDEEAEKSAADIIGSSAESELVRIFSEYGEERFSKRIAKAIIQSRKIDKIKTTQQLVEIIINAVPPKFRYGRIHPATRVFQALRIEVNQEFQNLKQALPQGVELLNLGGRLAVISFHSGEDRIVKNFFRDNKDKLEILTKKPVIPSDKEVEANPRSRSGKLRAIRVESSKSVKSKSYSLISRFPNLLIY